MKLVEVEAGPECRDLDTPEDLAWWRERLGERTLREVTSRGESGDGENMSAYPAVNRDAVAGGSLPSDSELPQ